MEEMVYRRTRTPTSSTSFRRCSSTRARRRWRCRRSRRTSWRIPTANGPFGAKEVGQGPLLPIPPAVANAVFDAVGVRVDEVPVTPEKVLRALKAKAKGQPARFGPNRFPSVPYPAPIHVLTPAEGGDGKARGCGGDGRRGSAVMLMMRLPKFRYFAPTTVREALRIRAGEGPDAAYVAGGTDLYPNMKRRQQTPKVVIGLSRVRALGRLTRRRIGRVDRRRGDALGDRDPEADAACLPGARPRDRGDLDASASQHGHARRESPARYPVQLLRPELRVAPGDRLLHEEGRRDLLGGARLAQVPGRPVGGFGAHPDRALGAARVLASRRGSARCPSRTSMPTTASTTSPSAPRSS